MNKHKQVDSLNKNINKRKQVDTLSEDNFNDLDDFDDYITNDSSYHEKRRKKKKTPLTLQQRKDRVVSLTNIKGYCLLMDTYIKDGRPEEAIITFDSLLAREHKSSISPSVVSYNTVINAHIELGEFLKGTERYTEMISRGITTRCTNY